MTADYYASAVLRITADTTIQWKKEMGHQPKSNSYQTCRGTFYSRMKLHFIVTGMTRTGTANLSGFWEMTIDQAIVRACLRSKVLFDNQGSARQATVDQLREDPVPEHANSLAVVQERDSQQSDMCRAGVHTVVYTTERGYVGKEITTCVQVFCLSMMMKQPHQFRDTQ